MNSVKINYITDIADIDFDVSQNGFYLLIYSGAILNSSIEINDGVVKIGFLGLVEVTNRNVLLYDGIKIMSSFINRIKNNGKWDNISEINLVLDDFKFNLKSPKFQEDGLSKLHITDSRRELSYEDVLKSIKSIGKFEFKNFNVTEYSHPCVFLRRCTDNRNENFTDVGFTFRVLDGFTEFQVCGDNLPAFSGKITPEIVKFLYYVRYEEVSRLVSSTIRLMEDGAFGVLFEKYFNAFILYPVLVQKSMSLKFEEIHPYFGYYLAELSKFVPNGSWFKISDSYSVTKNKVVHYIKDLDVFYLSIELLTEYVRKYGKCEVEYSVKGYSWEISSKDGKHIIINKNHIDIDTFATLLCVSRKNDMTLSLKCGIIGDGYNVPDSFVVIYSGCRIVVNNEYYFDYIKETFRKELDSVEIMTSDIYLKDFIK